MVHTRGSVTDPITSVKPRSRESMSISALPMNTRRCRKSGMGVVRSDERNVIRKHWRLLGTDFPDTRI